MIKFMDRKNSSQNLYHRVASFYLCGTYINPENKVYKSQNLVTQNLRRVDCVKAY